MSEQIPPASAPTPDSMALWFQKIFTEIDLVTRAINKKEGVFIFSKHVYSEEELKKSPAIAKIESIVGVIENVFESWVANSAVTAEQKKLYWDNRLKVESKLGEMQALIIERKPTFWENVVATLSHIIRGVMKALPMLPDYMLATLGIVFTEQQRRLTRVLDIDADDL